MLIALYLESDKKNFELKIINMKASITCFFGVEKNIITNKKTLYIHVTK